jgi:hypothetical protein
MGDTMTMMQTTVTEADGNKLMAAILNRYAFARNGAEVSIEIGDVYNGPSNLGHVLVILTVDGMQAMFPIADTVSFMNHLRAVAADWETRRGEIPDRLQQMLHFANQITYAVDCYYANDAAKRARPN